MINLIEESASKNSQNHPNEYPEMNPASQG